MGNSIIKSDSADIQGIEASSGGTASAVARKYSTVSTTARLLLYGEKVEYLSVEEKDLLRNCWKKIQSDVARVGVITFVQLFETHPDVKDVFMPFNGIQVEDLRHSQQLRSHALRVMGFVEKAVARLDEKEKFDKLLEELGKNHFYYGAPKKYIDFIGPQFVMAIEPSLQEIWNDEVKNAWIHLFKYIAFRMKESLTSAEKAKQGSK